MRDMLMDLTLPRSANRMLWSSTNWNHQWWRLVRAMHWCTFKQTNVTQNMLKWFDVQNYVAQTCPNYIACELRKPSETQKMYLLFVRYPYSHASKRNYRCFQNDSGSTFVVADPVVVSWKRSPNHEFDAWWDHISSPRCQWSWWVKKKLFHARIHGRSTNKLPSPA